MTDQPASIDDVAALILAYVADRPNACDTIDGIRSWWIPRQLIEHADGDVRAALELLVERGQLVRVDSVDGVDDKVLYRARPIDP